MEAHLSTKFYLDANGGEIESLKAIVKLAAQRLHHSPVVALSGSPLQSQAGLKGTDLINTKDMLTKLAKGLGMGELVLEPAAENKTQDSGVDVLAMMLSELFPLVRAKRTEPDSIFGLLSPALRRVQRSTGT